MTTSEIRQLLRGAASRPFTVHADGKTYFIDHPELAALTPPGKTLVVFHKEDNAFDLVDLELIVRVEVHEPQAS
jgi:hypothetical protein